MERERAVWRRGFHLPDDANKTQAIVWMLARLSVTGGARAAYLMERLDIDQRTLRRYVAELRSMGLVVVDQDRGAARTLRLHRAAFTVEVS